MNRDAAKLERGVKGRKGFRARTTDSLAVTIFEGNTAIAPPQDEHNTLELNRYGS